VIRLESGDEGSGEERFSQIRLLAKKMKTKKFLNNQFFLVLI
jgi:hypothetical protein